MYKIFQDDIPKWAKEYEGERFHGVLCDPPYHLTSIVKRFGKDGSKPAQFGTDGAYARHSGGFMNQVWDGGDVAFQPETWAAIGECLLPGAHLLAFGGSRTQHRLICAIEDAGFEIRDIIVWMYGSGFPKSHDISKQLDRKAGAKREVLSSYEREGRSAGIMGEKVQITRNITEPATDLAKVWDGYGTALKPAIEIIVLARKPVEGTIADNCAKYGAGAINIDGCRVPINGETVPINKLEEWSGFGQKERPEYEQVLNNKGRWPANLIHDGSEEVVDLFPRNAGAFAPVKRGHSGKSNGIYNDYAQKGDDGESFRGDSGSASRFFYTAKVSPSERNAGCEEMPVTKIEGDVSLRSQGVHGQTGKPNSPTYSHNSHPTLKPLALTEYLARLILPPEEYAPRRLLVPFAGAASEMIGAYRAGWDEIIGVELMEEYVKIAEARLKYWTGIPRQLELK